MSDYHKSVLLQQVLDYLRITDGKKYIDATLGGGGHTFAILRQGGKVFGLDVDEEALEYVKEEFKIQNPKFKIDKTQLTIAKGNFRDIDELARENGFGKVAGILFDLGVSSHQLDTPGRGFSFKFDATLDMRMDRDLSVKALDLLRVLTKGELYELFKNFGEESNALRIASNIVESRRISPIENTLQLGAIIQRSVRIKDQKTNPATRVFQALRIAVNDELGSIKEALPKALSLLETDGRVVVISFHSLEDRIVKHTFIDWKKKGMGRIITKDPIIPSEAEITSNIRSRSAKMRVFEKI